MNKPRVFYLIETGEMWLGPETHEILNFDPKDGAIKVVAIDMAYSELKEKLAVASESLTYERRERYKSDKKLLEKLAIVKSALEFYAERDNYCLYEDLSVDEWKYNWIAERPHPQKIDKAGTLATKALAKINEGE